MRTRKPKPWNVWATAVALLFVAGCAEDEDASGPKTVAGESGLLGGGEVDTWAKLDADGAVVEVGLTLSAKALAAAESAKLSLDLPEQVRTQTVLNHVQLDYNPAGHGPPTVYDVPHYDLHFYTIEESAVAAIDCAAEPMPAALPEPYFIPGTGMEPAGTCVPGMGVHALNGASPELDQTNPQPFDQTLILGYHDGSLAFLEPMVTQALMTSGQAFTQTIARPEGLAAGKLWPTQVTGTYDNETDTYAIVLSLFVAQ